MRDTPRPSWRAIEKPPVTFVAERRRAAPARRLRARRRASAVGGRADGGARERRPSGGAIASDAPAIGAAGAATMSAHA